MFNCNKSENYKDDIYEVGQIWQYQSRAGEENSELTIVNIENHQKNGVIINVFVDGLKIKNSMSPDGISKEIQHLPFSKEAINKSVVKLKRKTSTLPDFKAGYNEWNSAFKAGKAGIFTVPVKEVIQMMEQVASPDSTKK